jgi:hypothetical protein
MRAGRVMPSPHHERRVAGQAWRYKRDRAGYARHNRAQEMVAEIESRRRIVAAEDIFVAQEAAQLRSWLAENAGIFREP